MSPELLLYLIWFLWALSWFAAAFWAAPAARRITFRDQLASRIVTILGIALLFGIWSPRHMAMTQLWRPSERAMWALDGLIVLGFACAWWARVHLGKLWSAAITAKAQHHVVDSGPYALTRHPIYSGLIVSIFATAALEGSLVALVGAVLVTAGWVMKARLEERFLRAELGPAYDAYAARVAMFVPFLKF